MYWNVIEVKPTNHLVLSVRFTDGVTGIIRFFPSYLTGVFTPLTRNDFFKKVFLHNGVVTWPGEVDLAPDAMYDAIKRDGEWILK